MKRFLLLCMCLATLFACSDDSGDGFSADHVKMIVVNEGQMNKGTAALSAIQEDGTSIFDIFRDVNSRPLGDVAQSMTYINGYYFVALNNSKKIEVVEPQTFKSIATISYDDKEGKPRFIQPISATEAIVSDLNDQLVRINTKEFKVVEFIKTDVSVEKMQSVGDKLFCAAKGNGLVVFDNNNISNQGMRKVSGLVGGIMQTAKLILDKNDKLWVMTTESNRTILNCINTTTEKVERTVEIPYIKSSDAKYVDGCITGIPWFTRIDTDKTRSKLYVFMNILAGKKTDMGAIFTLNVDEEAISTKPYRELPGLGMMYGMGISPDGDVYLCDCLDYTAQRGFLREYKADGSVNSMRIGVYPRMIHFTEYDR